MLSKFLFEKSKNVERDQAPWVANRSIATLFRQFSNFFQETNKPIFLRICFIFDPFENNNL